MASSILNDDWVLCPDAKTDTLTWTKSLSRSYVSTVDGLGFSENVDVEAMNNLESLHRAIQQLKLQRLHVEDLEDVEFVANGETFAVSKCKYDGKVVAIKRIRLKNDGEGLNRRHFQLRLQSVLREVSIMCHPPLAYHPNIISLFGYGWTVEGHGPSPFISVEFAAMGSLREYMKIGHSIRTKLILMGDVGTGLMALHSCGIVHGDLKLDNVVVFHSLERPSGSIAKVSDFGHSILVGSAPEKQMQYFGTALYNAPEVANQKLRPIPTEMLHKCDVWAFGLCAWEILADGQVYFQNNCSSDPVYQRSPSYSWTFATSTETEKAHDDPGIATDTQYPLGHFDHSYLRSLAIDFVNGMSIGGSIGIEKGFLRPLMERTLQPDPADRISDLGRLPIIGFWNKAPGGHSLQAKLATYALSADLRYSMFRRENKLYIIWEQQRQLLHEFEAESESPQAMKYGGSAAFQTMLCYVNAFGTSKDLAKATQFLHKADTSGHLIARILGPRMLDGLSLTSSGFSKSYSECLSFGFNTTQKADRPSGISIHIQGLTTKFVDYTAFRQTYLLTAEDVDDRNTLMSFEGSPAQYHPLEFAIHNGDLELVDKMLSNLGCLLDAKHGKESFIEQAASRGHGPILNRLLKAKPPLKKDELTAILHWLFRFDDSSLRDISLHLQNWTNDSDFKSALDNPTSQEITIHPQWPFQIHGTPLATAISCGSVAAVRVLLELNADPLVACFKPNDSYFASGMTPIHLAVRYHQPEMLQMLWKACFGEKHIGLHPHGAFTLGQYPMACALSLMSNAERLAIHGSSYREKLRDTIQLFSIGDVVQASPQGQSAITQAIDLEDVDAVELLFERWPALASMKLVNPENRGLFTYPLHFAAEIGSERDTEESVQIMKTIINHDSTIISRLDNSSVGSSVRPIQIAAMGSSRRILEFLLECGASVHDLDETGQGPLHFCRSSRSVEILLRSGALINHTNYLGLTALHVAADRGRAEVLQALIEAGAALEPRDKHLMTPLHYAVQQKNRTMTQILLKTDININSQDDMGNTPLLLAVNIGSLAMVTLLVDKGADPFIENKKGSSPFLISLTDKAVAVLSKFQGHSGFRTLSWSNKTRALHWASERGSSATLRLYLDQMTKTPQAQLQMASAIHTAAKACRADLVKVLLSNDFEVDALDTGGNTALLLVCQTGRYSNFENDYQRVHLCETLILAGANMAVRNYHNHTPFSIAEAHRDYELMALLLHYTLKLNKVNSGIESAQLMQSTMFIYKDEQFCKEARSLIGGKTIAPELIRDAVKREEWDFVMTCIGGHFIGKRDLGIEWGGQAWGLRIDRLDELRFLCVQRDREMVRYVFEKIRRDDDDTIPHPKTHVGHRNLESELKQSKSRLKELIWAGEMKSFRETLSDIVRIPNASEDLTFEVDGNQAFGSDVLEAFSLYAKNSDDLQRQIRSAGRDLGEHQSTPEHTGQNSPDGILGSLAINLKAFSHLRESSQQSNLNRPLYLPELSDLDMVGWRYLDAKRTITFLHQQVEISYILMKAWSKGFDNSTNSWKLNGSAVWMWAQSTLLDIQKHCEQAADSLRLLTAYFQKKLDTQPEEEEETWRSLHQAASSLIPHLNELGKEISWASDQLGKARAKKQLGTKGLKDLCRKHIGRAIVMKANFLF